MVLLNKAQLTKRKREFTTENPKDQFGCREARGEKQLKNQTRPVTDPILVNRLKNFPRNFSATKGSVPSSK